MRALFDRKIIGIMASDPQGVIGKNGLLPWNYPEELNHFRRVTDGHVIVMGRKSFESTPQSLLENRTAIVFSRNDLSSHTEKYRVVSSLEEFAVIQDIPKEFKVFVIGGSEIAGLFLKSGLISEFLLTKIHKSYEGDVYLDLQLLENWNQKEIIKTQDYTIYRMMKNEH